VTPILDVDALRILRDGTPILRDVTWRIDPGQHWVVLGPNGSGKTSLLAALTGYLMPTAGRIDLLGQRYGESDWRALRTRIGMVSSSIRQLMADAEPALESVASGRYAMIDFWGRPNRADRHRALEILNQVECAHLADRPWAVLSQGERQRILIGRALMSDPRLLILDEPCAGLDPIARERFLQFIERIATRPNAPALIFVTHHVEEIFPCFTHALLLRDGAVVAAGPLKSALTSSLLSQTLGSPVRLARSANRYTLTVKPQSNTSWDPKPSGETRNKG
jgi:iron complex transport system ATP-binding protein